LTGGHLFVAMNTLLSSLTLDHWKHIRSEYEKQTALLIFECLANSSNKLFFAAADKIPELCLNENLIGIRIKIHEELFFLGLQGRQGQVNHLFDLPCAVSHVSVCIYADFKIGFLGFEKFFAFIIFCGHIQDHFA